MADPEKAGRWTARQWRREAWFAVTHLRTIIRVLNSQTARLERIESLHSPTFRPGGGLWCDTCKSNFPCDTYSLARRPSRNTPDPTAEEIDRD